MSTELLTDTGLGLVELTEVCRMHPEDLAVLLAKEPVHSAVAAVVGEQAA